MNDPSHEHKEPLCNLLADQDESGIKPLALDPEEYRKDLEEFDLTKDQQDELLEVLFNIMRTFVEIGFGLDSVQMFSTATIARSGEFTGSDSGKLLDRKNNPQQFNRAADHSGGKEA